MDKYLKNLKLPTDGISRCFGNLEVNGEITGKIIEDVSEITINNLYAHLMIKFHEAGVYKENNINFDVSIIERIKAFLFLRKNRNAANYGTAEWKEQCYAEKIWINNLYNKELRMFAPMIFELNRQYLTAFYKDIIEQNRFNWLYIDTDSFFVAGNIESTDVFEYIKIPFDIQKHECFYIEKPKKVIYGNIEKIEVKGFHKRYYPSDVVAIMKEKIRDKKIDMILS